MWPYVPHCSSPESSCFIAKCIEASKWARFSVCTGEKISTSGKRTRKREFAPSFQTRTQQQLVIQALRKLKHVICVTFIGRVSSSDKIYVLFFVFFFSISWYLLRITDKHNIHNRVEVMKKYILLLYNSEAEINKFQKLPFRRWYAWVTKASLDQWGNRMMDTVFIKAGKSRQRFWNLGPSDDTVRTTRRFSLTVLEKRVRNRVNYTSKYQCNISLP